MWFLIVVLVLAALGLLGAVLKAVLLVIGAIVLAVVVAGWLGYRSLRKQLEQASARQAPPGTTTIVIGEAARDDEPPGQLPHGRDDRY
jgi:membrane protein implicated in regulation of membrane protease activity